MAKSYSAETETEAIVSRVVEEVWNEGNYDVVDEYMTDETVAHYPGIDPIQGPEAYKELAQRYHTAFSDFHVEITDLFSDEDHVVTQYRATGTHDGPLDGGPTDVPPTGNEVDVDGIAVVRFEDDTPVEEYNRSDSIRMFEQLGLLG
jgi:predicted ester cyclase